MKIINLFAYLLLAVPFSAGAQIIIPTSQPTSVSSQARFFRDPAGTFSVEEVMAMDSAFQEVSDPVPSFGNTTDAIWLQFTVANNLDNIFLEIENPNLHFIDFYFPDSNGDYDVTRTGFLRPFESRPIATNDFFVFPLRKSDKPEKYFLRVKSDHFLNMPMEIAPLSVFKKSFSKRSVFYAIFFGIVFSLFLYNLVIFIITRRKTYLYYVLFLAIQSWVFLFEKGVGFQLLWQNIPELNLRFPILPFLSQIFGILFLQSFLETRQYARTLHKISNGIIFLSIAGIGVNLSGNYVISIAMAQMLAMAMVVVSFLQMYVTSRNGNDKGVLHVLAMTSFLVFLTLFLLSQNNVLPDHFLLRNGLAIGTALECILFSFVLANWINEIERKKSFELEKFYNYITLSEASLQSNLKKLEASEAELQAINDRLMNSQEAMRQIAEEQLEQSESLMLAEIDLQNALENEKQRKRKLIDTQSQLVNNEKMASLGQLTAGIAHEINNPINFIYNGIDTLKLTYSELKPIVNKVKQFGNGHDENQLIDEITHLRREYQIEELKSDMHELVSDIKLGAVRTMEIVKGLRVFSRLDEEEQKLANINENIEATLVLLRNKTKNKIEIRKNFESSNQEILCYPGQLNQVFMNIIGNAIQAIPEDRTDGKIVITTELNEHMAIIRIKDNGTGMPESVRKRIFEPFFTTKPVGVGTGLGLSISYGIVEKHKGQMFVTSEEGKGTEFVIHIPRT